MASVPYVGASNAVMTDAATTKVLIVEDEAHIAYGIRRILTLALVNVTERPGREAAGPGPGPVANLARCEIVRVVGSGVRAWQS